MHPASHTAPARTPTHTSARTSARASRAYALLTATLLTLLTVLTTTGGTGGTGITGITGITGTSVAAAPGTHTAAPGLAGPDATAPTPRADEQCPAVCTAQAGTRQEHRGERPAPPGHLATTPDTTAVPPPAPARTPPARAPAHASLSRPVPDRDRAPPAPSGTRRV
ncbi:hypothetical protein [Streptomyces sp. 16-176A]|uniref:hypothetical protein n=1 Tax=Streptomyces sp. 16-176A TaxID=2530458 RepID=UPI00345CED45